MGEITEQELRSHTSDVLHRVEGGEEIIVMIDGRSVARIIPMLTRPRSLPWQQLLAHQADPGMAKDIRELLGDEDTDTMLDPWQKAERRA